MIKNPGSNAAEYHCGTCHRPNSQFCDLSASYPTINNLAEYETYKKELIIAACIQQLIADIADIKEKEKREGSP